MEKEIKILLYGMQRSGTNYLEQLLKKDERVTFINSTDRKNFKHKHYRFFDKKNIMQPEYIHEKEIFCVNDIYEKSEADLIVVIKKNVYDWYTSVIQWANQCKWRFSDKEFSEEYIEEYYLNYKFFENENVILIDYHDLLFNRDKIIKILSENGIEIGIEDFVIDNVFASNKKNEHYLDKYSTHNLQYKKDIDVKLFKLENGPGIKNATFAALGFIEMHRCMDDFKEWGIEIAIHINGYKISRYKENGDMEKDNIHSTPDIFLYKGESLGEKILELRIDDVLNANLENFDAAHFTINK